MKPHVVPACLALAAAAGCTRTTAANRGAGPPAVPVTVAEARLADVPDRIDAVLS